MCSFIFFICSFMFLLRDAFPTIRLQKYSSIYFAHIFRADLVPLIIFVPWNYFCMSCLVRILLYSSRWLGRCPNTFYWIIHLFPSSLKCQPYHILNYHIYLSKNRLSIVYSLRYSFANTTVQSSLTYYSLIFEMASNPNKYFI